ncbi:MAG: methyltransferase (TIGR00027 family) [Myxococcota bacterium]|jgi:methyltransferase (TIGR00027 family)
MPTGASLTAEIVCYFRAMEQRKPADLRVVDDPFAERFLRKGLRWWLQSALSLPWGVHRTVDPWAPGSIGDYVVGRHRFMDDRLLAALEGDAAQVVVLGAGYDSRGLRFSEMLGERPLFELDFPATQHRKMQRLASDVAGGALGARIHYLPVDFEKDAFDDVLRGSSFEPGRRTFFVWEGVTMYLQPETVRDTLRRLHALSGPGSELVADLWHRPGGMRPTSVIMRGGGRLLSAIGEPLGLSLPPAETAAFLAETGWALDEQILANDLQVGYGMVARRVRPSLYVVRATRASDEPTGTARAAK